jgi:tryptophan synthase beta chain
VIGDEAREQALAAEGELPARVIACVGGGSNAIGTFYPFIADERVELIGIEAGGEGLNARHGASLVAGRTGVLHGALSSVLAGPDGQILEAHSVSAGLDYPGVGPEHAQLRDSGRARYEAVTDAEALRAFRELARLEGILPALEPAHAIAWMLKGGQPGGNPAGADAGAEEGSRSRRRGQVVPAGVEQPAGYDVVCLSGRGDKDLAEAVARLQELDG